MKNVVFLSGTLGALLFISASVLGGLQIDSYSFVSQLISESYATGIPNATYLRNMYVISGLLLALFGFTAPMEITKRNYVKILFFLFAIFYGVGTITTGFFPCDIGCPSEGENISISQIIHNASGFLTYTIVPFCLIGIGLTLKRGRDNLRFYRTTLICGIIAFIFVIVLFGNSNGLFIGLFQRLIEGSILYWVVYTSVFIRKA